MVKKLQKMAAKQKAAAETGFPSGLLDSPVAQSVKDSAQQIWAAGLASFNKAQGEGSKVFEALVSEGLKLQKKTQSAAEDKLGAMASRFTGMASEVGTRAGQHWDKLESIFEQRVAKALKTLGVPTAGDLDTLLKRLDELSALAGLKPTPAAKPAKPASRKAAAKPVTTPAGKGSAKAPAKPAAKAAVKPAVKAAAKTAAKAPEKATAPAAKKAGRSTVAKAAKPAAPVKPAARTAARKSTRKVAPAA
ncbi:MAG: poly granule associated protein [Roseateles depolymerans]|uniref:Poly granule associated protein n=1 Tax=Roseateles depolymerans TaxID=76731 RepID=A0A2W5FXS5_9BURK|nr:MAG: poly granule associated protein [Roseateles depolymerans]